MTTYRAHRCKRRHRLYRSLARCIWKRAEMIVSEGPYAVRLHGPNPDIWLFKQQQGAEYHAALFDRCGCGPYCRGKHQVAQLVLS
jgi:hypothetical protein